MIFWFSGTGNSLRAATELARCTGDRMFSIAEALKKQEWTYAPGAGEPVGIVVPVYYWGLPASVHTFLQGLRFENDEKPSYVYAVLVCGGSACNAVGQIKKYLEVDYAAELCMPDNYILMYDMKHPEDLKNQLRLAEAQIGKIYNVVRKREKNPRGSAPGLFSELLTKTVYPQYDKRRVTAPFHVVEDRCIGCGKCVSYCPGDVIRLEDGKPVWTKERCDQCLACLHRCPQEAIQYGDKTLTRRRYQHPMLKD